VYFSPCWALALCSIPQFKNDSILVIYFVLLHMLPEYSDDPLHDRISTVIVDVLES
jgi:hypothetical protein